MKRANLTEFFITIDTVIQRLKKTLEKHKETDY